MNLSNNVNSANPCVENDIRLYNVQGSEIEHFWGNMHRSTWHATKTHCVCIQKIATPDFWEV